MFGFLKKHHEDQLKALGRSYEKKIYDLEQLIEISKSLNSSLDYNQLIQSIMYICMGQLKVLKAGLFARKDVDRQDLVLHRSMVGFEVNHEVDYIIPENHPLILFFQKNLRTYTFSELQVALPDISEFSVLSSLDPYLLVPLRAKEKINGILVLGEPIQGISISNEDRKYVLDIAHLAGIAVNNAFLYEVTTTDMMTKLKLKHYFIDMLQDAMITARRDEKPLAMVMIDIDHFKKLNDTHGHLCGDMVIQQVATIMLDKIRQTDLAARYGGEEFVLLLPDTDIPTAMAIAERIRLALAETEFTYEDKTLSLTVSLGITNFDLDKDLSTFSFINRADNAMYHSKRTGRNKVSIL